MSDLPENAEYSALISLMDEPDETIFSRIRNKVISLGTIVVPYLEKSWENTFDNLTQQRIRETIQTIQKRSLRYELINWKNSELHDLLKGFMLVNRFRFPDTDEGNISRRIGRISQDIWLELNEGLTALEKVKVFNHVFYEILGFSGNIDEISDPENTYLSVLLDSKKGNPLSLGVFYSILAQSLKMPVYGVPLPEHYILAYLSEPYKNDKITGEQKDVLFYINPFSKGEVFTKLEISRYLKQLKLESLPSYYYPCDNQFIIRMIFFTLIALYQNAGDSEKAGELEDLVKILE